MYDEATEEQAGPTLALYDTTRERDVDLVADIFSAGVEKGSKGVRVVAR